jgi:hypothetical protein
MARSYDLPTIYIYILPFSFPITNLLLRFKRIHLPDTLKASVPTAESATKDRRQLQTARRHDDPRQVLRACRGECGRAFVAGKRALKRPPGGTDEVSQVMDEILMAKHPRRTMNILPNPQRREGKRLVTTAAGRQLHAAPAGNGIAG